MVFGGNQEEKRERLDTKGDPLFPPLCRVDPWECYQDTWQTTCSVLEHHRDLMKVSRPCRGVRDHRSQAGCGEGAAGLLTWFRLWFLTNQAPSGTRAGGGLGTQSSPRACTCPAPLAGSDLGLFSSSGGKFMVG